jgi:phosphohistidine phosphatase
MLTLLIMRHCHAHVNLAARLNDRTRSLSPQGEAAALEVGQALAGEQFVPQLILTSNATRTQQTANIVAKSVGALPTVISPRAHLYHGSAEDYLEIINGENSNYSTILIIGHNPAVSTFFGSCRAKGMNTGFFKPGELAILEVDIASWAQLRFHLANCTGIISPMG